MSDDHPPLTDPAAIRARRPAPSARVRDKEIDHLDAICRRFIAASPFVILGTVRPDGLPDLSPRGDGPGFVRVLDDRTLVLPDRAGNNRLESFSNLARNPALGLIFLIPGHGDTLRLRGRGEVRDDPALRSLFPGTRPPDMVLRVRVETAFLHCARSLTRAALWQPDRWPDRAGVPSLAEAMKAHGNLPEPAEEIEAIFRANDARILGEEGAG